MAARATQDGGPLADGFEPADDARWRALVDKALKGADFDKRLVSRSDDGLALQPLYTRGDVITPLQESAPGTAPFQRGFATHEDYARQFGGWDIRQRHGDDDPAAVNRAVLADLAGGVTSIDIQIAAPGQTGLPSDAAAFETALAGVDLNLCPLALHAGDVVPDGAGFMLAAWRTQDIAPEAYLGALNADPLGTLARTGGLYRTLSSSLDVAVTLLGETRRSPRLSALLADGSIYHDAGASQAQELAATLATALAYLRAAEERDIAPADALEKIAFRLAADADQFMTLAKFRALRLLIARLAEAASLEPVTGPIQAITSFRMLTVRDPWVNMLRNTMACASAAFAGADTITVLPFTAAFAKPDAFAHRMARNTQIVLQEESHLGHVRDPAGGAWFVERLTHDLAQHAWTLFQEIEAGGGMAQALIDGSLAARIEAQAQAREERLAQGETAITGVSAFPHLQADNVNGEPLDQPLPANVNGVRATALPPRRLSLPFERLRDAAEAAACKTTTAAPKVFLAALGEPAQFSARATWVGNFFAAGGLDMIDVGGFSDTRNLGAAFAESGASIVCLCGTDDSYETFGEAAAGVLKEAGAKLVLLAGRPGPNAQALRSAGVDDFIHARCDHLAALKRAHATLGLEVHAA